MYVNYYTKSRIDPIHRAWFPKCNVQQKSWLGRNGGNIDYVTVLKFYVELYDIYVFVRLRNYFSWIKILHTVICILVCKNIRFFFLKLNGKIHTYICTLSNNI